MRIAYFTDCYDRDHEMAHFARHYAQYCAQNNIDADIFIADDAHETVETLGTVRLIRFQPGNPDNWMAQVESGQLPSDFLKKHLADQSYDIIHTAAAGSAGLCALILAGRLQRPLFACYHTYLPEAISQELTQISQHFVKVISTTPLPAPLLLLNYIQWFYNQADKVLVMSEHTRQQLQARLTSPMELLPLGVDISMFHPGPREGRSTVTALYVGEVSREKNVNVIAEIFQARTDVNFVVVGQGSYLPQLRQLCPHAQVHEHLDLPALAEVFADADFFISPSTTDGTAETILQALAAGLPVILTNKTPLKELIQDRRSGFVISSTLQLQDQLDRIIKDSVMREDMSLEARQRAVGHAWPAVFQLLQQYYQQAVS